MTKAVPSFAPKHNRIPIPFEKRTLIIANNSEQAKKKKHTFRSTTDENDENQRTTDRTTERQNEHTNPKPKENRTTKTINKEATAQITLHSSISLSYTNKHTCTHEHNINTKIALNGNRAVYIVMITRSATLSKNTLDKMTNR